MPCAQHDLYKPIRQRLKDYMETTTLADLASSLKAKLSWQRTQSTASSPSAGVGKKRKLRDSGPRRDTRQDNTAAPAA
jgi:hypothetical protein